jgi:hypothetical protein
MMMFGGRAAERLGERINAAVAARSERVFMMVYWRSEGGGWRNGRVGRGRVAVERHAASASNQRQ